MSRAESVLISTETRLHDRSITVAQLRLLEKNVDRFLELCTVWDLSQKETKRLPDKAHSLFRARLAEVEKYEHEKRLAEKFVKACVSVCETFHDALPPGLQVLSQKLRKVYLSNDVRSLCHLDSEEAAVVPHIPVPPTCRQYLQPIGTALDSLIFRRIWSEKTREVWPQRRSQQSVVFGRKPLMLSVITDLICAPVISQWKCLCFEVQDGSISLELVVDVFGSLTNDPGALERELSCMAVSSHSRENCEWKRQRQRQIQQYFKLKERIQAAHALKGVISALEIPHSFKEIDTICRKVCFYT